ncbi:MAG: hypothetical protein ACRD40_01800 [Candidatus Acidiferrales bacterium]
MDHNEFLELHAGCVAAMRAYVVEAEKSCTLLGKCTGQPLTFEERMALLCQAITENDAHMSYLGAKSFLHGAALLGYGSLN